MEMFVNNAGASVNTRKPMLDGRSVGGTETDITSHPYQVWPGIFLQSDDILKYLIKKRLPVFVMTTS
jgi:hypothetical protein